MVFYFHCSDPLNLNKVVSIKDDCNPSLGRKGHIKLILTAIGAEHREWGTSLTNRTGSFICVSSSPHPALPSPTPPRSARGEFIWSSDPECRRKVKRGEPTVGSLVLQVRYWWARSIAKFQTKLNTNSRHPHLKTENSNFFKVGIVFESNALVLQMKKPRLRKVGDFLTLVSDMHSKVPGFFPIFPLLQCQQFSLNEVELESHLAEDSSAAYSFL